MKKLKVLSLFDGISGAAQALKELGIECDYFASEIDKFAIQISKKNHPEIVQIGDVNSVDFTQFRDIDLLVGGFPCQDLSIAKRGGDGLKGARSGLFSKCLEALEICKPKYFLFENVASMKKEWSDKISDLLSVQPIMICSSKLTAQMRKRLYWTNIPNIQPPEDKGIILKDILESGDTEKLKSYCITATYNRACPEDYFNHGQRQLIFKSSIQIELGIDEMKAVTRKLTEVEVERLQGFPDFYSEGISQTQRYKALGNSFTVPVIKHILKNL